MNGVGDAKATQRDILDKMAEGIDSCRVRDLGVLLLSSASSSPFIDMCSKSTVRLETEGRTLRTVISSSDVRLPLLGCLALSLVSLRYLRHPYVTIDLLLAVLSCWIAFRRKLGRLEFCEP